MNRTSHFCVSSTKCYRRLTNVYHHQRFTDFSLMCAITKVSKTSHFITKVLQTSQYPCLRDCDSDNDQFIDNYFIINVYRHQSVTDFPFKRIITKVSQTSHLNIGFVLFKEDIHLKNGN